MPWVELPGEAGLASGARSYVAVAASVVGSLGLLSLWFGILQSSFPVKLIVYTQSNYQRTRDCGTFFHTASAADACVGPLQFRRVQVIVAVLVGVLAITIALRLGRTLVRSIRWGRWLVCGVAVFAVLLALVGLFAVYLNYSRFTYGDSAWTAALSSNTFHRRVWHGGILVLLIAGPVAFIGLITETRKAP